MPTFCFSFLSLHAGFQFLEEEEETMTMKRCCFGWEQPFSNWPQRFDVF